jgi:hypothetical protein
MVTDVLVIVAYFPNCQTVGPWGNDVKISCVVSLLFCLQQIVFEFENILILFDGSSLELKTVEPVYYNPSHETFHSQIFFQTFIASRREVSLYIREWNFLHGNNNRQFLLNSSSSYG